MKFYEILTFGLNLQSLFIAILTLLLNLVPQFLVRTKFILYPMFNYHLNRDFERFLLLVCNTEYINIK